jgi:myo-inositol-hexaphosphate 3-phosphohydrolase
MIRRTLALVVALLAVAGTAHAAPAGLVSVPSTLETAMPTTTGDNADDPAIWVNTADPAASLIVTNEKKSRKLVVYDLSGNVVQTISDGVFWGNVDVRGDTVVAAHSGFAIYHITAAGLTPIKEASGNVATGGEGICLWNSGSQLYAINVHRTTFRVRVHPLLDSDHDGLLSIGASVKSWYMSSEGESCVVDDATGIMYLAQEDVGIWAVDLNTPGQDPARSLFATVGANLTSDIEGLAIANGVLYASAQNVANPKDNWISMYSISTGTHLGNTRVGIGTASDDCDQTDGLDVTATPLPGFPSGMIVCQDGYNDAPGSVGPQNFKYAPLPAPVAP